MSVTNIFKTFVEPSLERIPVLEVSHIERHQGREYVISQKIQRNVFTEFDRKLSRHLAATRGTGFPAFTVSVQVNERGSGAPARFLAPAHHESVPHALKGIADRAFAHCDSDKGEIELTVHHDDRGGSANGGGVGITRLLRTDDIDALDSALKICRHLGEAEFLNISGDFDIVIAGPPGDQNPVIMHLQNGSLSMPCATGSTITPFECPIHGFSSHAANNISAQGYLARARHALVATKEAAVVEFRAAAEDRILSFDKALGQRGMDGHRMDAAIALVERLKTGLGSSLSGLSEDAQVTALDWSMEIASDDSMAATGRRRITLAHAAAAQA
jgi:predicted Fe-Mo cluster-binding NifX family protein